MKCQPFDAELFRSVFQVGRASRCCQVVVTDDMHRAQHALVYHGTVVCQHELWELGPQVARADLVMKLFVVHTLGCEVTSQGL